MTWFGLSNKDQTENSVIDDINEIGINSFTDNGFAVIRKNLPDATKFHQNKIDKTFLAHVSPCLSIIMVFIQHGVSGKVDVVIVALFYFIRVHFFHFTVSNRQLYQPNNTIIDNPLEFSRDVIAYFLDFFFLKGSDAHCFDKELVSDGNNP